MLHQDDYFQPFTALSVHPLVPIVLVIQEWKAPPLLSIWPHLFRGAGHEKRRGEQLRWSLAFSLYIGSFPCAQQSSYSPVGPSVFCVFSLLFVFLSFVCVSPSFYVSLGS